MNLFHVIDDAHAVLRSRGVFRQVPVFRRGDELFAKWGVGFVKLLSSGHSTHPYVSWLELDTNTLTYIQTPSGLKLLEGGVPLAKAA